ncbi:MAG TPA: hypothetical protein VFK48_17580 [Usitatibacter sp.]|nr:hypothetical protein [Usitatibacter sp.]
MSPAVRAASDADLAEIRAQIRELRSQYESRIEALERRLREAESRAAPAAPPAAPPASLPAPSTTSTSSAFNPAISAILQGTYAHLSRDPSTWRIAGFASGGEIGPGRRGFGIGESELVLSANVDPHFAGHLVLAVTPENEVGVEEAYGRWLTAPFGLSTKVGRFLSGIGYLNELHSHAWDFVDAPLASQAFLGGRYANDGVQVKWVAPIERFFELGAEAGNGDAFPGSPRNRNGAGSAAVYAHTGGDVGVSHSWRAGVSLLATRAQDRVHAHKDLEGNDVALAFSGRSRVAIADFVWKYAPQGNARETSLKVQGEYFRRRERGELAYGFDGLFAQPDAYSSTQSGWYLQGVYQFRPEWRVGLRTERLETRAIDYGANAAFLEGSDFKPRRSSVMLDFNPSEFSRIRLQYSRSRTMPGAADNEWLVQYILSLGAHGAHRY